MDPRKNAKTRIRKYRFVGISLGARSRTRPGVGSRHATVALVTAVFIILLGLYQLSYAAGQDGSGTAQLSDTLQYGTVSYAVDYSHPSVAMTGTNLTVQVTLHVNALTGLIEYVSEYKVAVLVSIDPSHTLAGSVSAPFPAPALYPGGTWGPVNVTIPITETGTGLSKGQSANGSLIIMLQNQLWYGGQVGTYLPEPPLQGAADTVLIQNSPAQSTTTTSSPTQNGPASGTEQNYMPYALMAIGAIMVLLAAISMRGSPSKASSMNTT